jgi:predicted RNase H-like HicB family nuclease
MNSLKIELIADDEEGGFTARIPDLPAYGEGATEEAAIADLKEAVAGYIDSFGLEDALSRIVVPTVREVIWDLAGMSHG